MRLPNPPNIIHVPHQVICLHLDHVTNGEAFLLLPARPLDEHVPLPRARYLPQQLGDVAPVNAKERQRWLDRPARIIPPPHPRILWQVPVPLQIERDAAVAERYLDADFPQVVPINDVMHDLADGPRVGAQRRVEIRFRETLEGGFQLGGTLGVTGEDCVWIGWLLCHEYLSLSILLASVASRRDGNSLGGASLVCITRCPQLMEDRCSFYTLHH